MHFVGSPVHPRSTATSRRSTRTAWRTTSRSPTTTVPPTDMVLGLRYVDRFEQRDGTWLIAKRVCSFDWVYRVPFNASDRSWFAEGFTVGARDRTDITYQDL